MNTLKRFHNKIFGTHKYSAILSLPIDVLVEIFTYMHYVDIINCSITCKKFKKAYQIDSIWLSKCNEWPQNDIQLKIPSKIIQWEFEYKRSDFRIKGSSKEIIISNGKSINDMLNDVKFKFKSSFDKFKFLIHTESFMSKLVDKHYCVYDGDRKKNEIYAICNFGYINSLDFIWSKDNLFDYDMILCDMKFHKKMFIFLEFMCNERLFPTYHKYIRLQINNKVILL